MASPHAQALRRDSTLAERRLWSKLRLRQLAGARFRRQHPIGPYIVDFICLEQKLVIELDGSQHQEAVSYDEARTAWLAASGYHVMRFWNSDVLRNTEGVLTVILEAIGGWDPPP